VGVIDRKDPDGRFVRQVALVNKIAILDNDLATAPANYAAGKGDFHSVHDLVLAQQGFVKQRDLLPSR
jgi:hypothetical protein